MHILVGAYGPVDVDLVLFLTLPYDPDMAANASARGQWARRLRRAGRAAWLVTGPILNARVRPRRVPLLGPEARD
jgi:hypothetical protein